MSSPGVKFNLTPELLIKILLNVEQIVLVDVFAYKFIGEGSVEF